MEKSVEYILDVPVDITTLEEIEQEIKTHLESNQTMVLASINPQILLMSEKSPTVKSFISTATHRFADGIGVVKMSGWTKGQLTERIAGIDVMDRVLTVCHTMERSVFLYGAKPEVVQQAGEAIQAQYPNLKVVGCVDGYGSMSDRELIQRINDSGADVLFVALGSPRQEEWLSHNMSELNVTVYQTVGGSFDVYSGTVKRAPDLFIKLNLEWLYRSVSNPKRFNRIFQVPLFVVKGLMWNQKHRRQ